MKAMDEINDGEYLFYCDSGAVFISDTHRLIPDLDASGKDMMVFEQPLLARAFTKRETYHLLGCSDYKEYRRAVANKRLALYMDIRSWCHNLPKRIRRKGKNLLLALGLEGVYKRLR
ncbi:MAG: hypothetical protein NC388_07490 [Clostridium sp.]|nr:hypothetical protein [Clostridium sp.]